MVEFPIRISIKSDFVARIDLLQRTLDMLILRVLNRGQMHGWGIAQRIHEVSRDVLTVLSIVFFLILACGCRSTRQPETAVGPRIHVLTYNVNWGGPRPDLAAEVIGKSGADVVCLQETTPQWEQFLRRSFSKEYP